MPVRMDADGWKVLLVATRRRSDVWVFPKGAIGRDERPKAAAVRETREVRVPTAGVGLGRGAFARAGSWERRAVHGAAAPSHAYRIGAGAGLAFLLYRPY